jgi:hypothetical protein
VDQRSLGNKKKIEALRNQVALLEKGQRELAPKAFEKLEASLNALAKRVEALEAPEEG